LLESPSASPASSRLAGIGRSPARHVELPRGVAVIGVGGSTLGGSGRTPVAIAVAHALASRGHSVALVGHGYGGDARSPRFVSVEESAAVVGDEALIAARALDGLATVIAGGGWRASLEAASLRARIVVVDRVLQTEPRPLACALLAVDSDQPWGSGRLPPWGDLVAPVDALRAAADVIVRIGTDEARSTLAPVGAFTGRCGLVTSLARPHRVLHSLAAGGVSPVFHVERSDHAPLRRAEADRLADLAHRRNLVRWVVDAKTAVWCGELGPRALGVPTIALDHRVELSESLVDAVEARARDALEARAC
jgi:tetraacyldisaccharide 4'-kinase